MRLSAPLKWYLKSHPRLVDKIVKRIQNNGYDLISGISPTRALYTQYGINQIFDIGANQGQYGQWLRRLGYNGQIISFEPVRQPFETLSQNVAKDPLWTAVNMGCGNYDGEAVINISANSLFSSLLPQTSVLQTEYKAKTYYVSQETIKICTIDKIFRHYYAPGNKVLLKIDTQGFEKNVLDGSLESLNDILAVQLELSYRIHYEGELLIKDMIDYMYDKGFTLIALETLQNNFKKKKLLQGDGIFFKLDKV